MEIHHIGIQVESIKESADFYCNKFHAKCEYIDETWAMLVFDNIKLALVLPKEHPPHICFEKDVFFGFPDIVSFFFCFSIFH